MTPRVARALLALLATVFPATAARAQTPGTAAPAQPPATAQARSAADFVRVRDGHFEIAGQPYYFFGVNFWFGMNLGAEGPGGDRPRLIRELDRLQALGVTNLRLTAASEGPPTEQSRVVPPVQPAAGKYDEKVLRGLDFLLAEMAKRHMRGVLILNNFFQWTGGMAQYVSWATGEPIPYPEHGAHSWDEFQDFSSRFYTLEKAQSLFEQYVGMLVNRRNTITGVLYRDDPTIMSWQLSNEPRGRVNSEAYVRWVDRAGKFIRERAPNQLISLGGEGKLVPVDSTQFARVSRSPYLDYLTVHIWPQNWGWFDSAHGAETFDLSVGRTMGYLADHVAIATEVRKPVVFEEFGLARDNRQFAPGTPVTYRDHYYSIVLEAIDFLARQGTVVAGGNLWTWTGEGRAPRPGDFWHPGEPFTGDPSHELQGWYSIYDTDSTTTAILSKYAHRLDEVGKQQKAAPPWAWP